MKKTLYIFAAALCMGCIFSCKEQTIPVYQVEDSAVFFGTETCEFSLKGATQERPEIDVTLHLMGPVCDYDREILLEFPDSSFNDAVQGVDFNVVSAKVKAGEMEGHILLQVKMPDAHKDRYTFAVSLVPNKDFPHVVKNKYYSKITWTDGYVRPSNVNAWRSWWYFFCVGYSKNYHQLMFEYFGDVIEHSGYDSNAIKDPDTNYYPMSWWYASSRAFAEFVRKHDQEHPDDPYMHSDDYEYYLSYKDAPGTGIKPDVVPTILSTLISM